MTSGKHEHDHSHAHAHSHAHSHDHRHGDKRHALWNARLNTHENGGTTTRRLTSVPEIRDVLANTFLITLPEGDKLDPALEKALRPGASD